MREPGNNPEESELIARLLRLAGPRPDAPADLKERIRHAVHARWLEQGRARRRRRRAAWLAGALAAAALVTIVVLAGRTTRIEAPAPPVGPAATVVLSAGPLRGADGVAVPVGGEVPAGAVLQTGEDGRAALQLGDGASLRMDVMTRVTVHDGSTVRLERGRVYVDSGMATDPTRHLEIRTGFGVLRDVGTQFEASQQDAGLRVRVRQGVVQLDHQGRSHEVRSGAELTVDGRGGATWGTVSPYGDEWSWVLDAAPAFVLEGSTLDDFLDWVSSETGLNVTFADDAAGLDAGRIVLHGSVAGVRPDQAPDVVLPTCGLRYEIAGDTMIIHSAGDVGDGDRH